MNDSQVRLIVRDEILGATTFDQIQILTGNSLEAKVEKKVEQAIEAYTKKFKSLPYEVQKATAKYLQDHLEKEIKASILSLLPDLVKAQVYDRLSTLSGVQSLLETHNGLIRGQLEQQLHNFQTINREQQEQLLKIGNQIQKDFEAQAKQTADLIVAELVGSNGKVLKGFKDELAAQNGKNFETLANGFNRAYHNQDLENKMLKNRVDNQDNTIFWLKVVTYSLVLFNGFYFYNLYKR